jgi:hypothetical protein
MALDDTRHARHGAAKKRNKFQPLEEEEEKKNTRRDEYRRHFHTID